MTWMTETLFLYHLRDYKPCVGRSWGLGHVCISHTQNSGLGEWLEAQNRCSRGLGLDPSPALTGYEAVISQSSGGAAEPQK